MTQELESKEILLARKNEINRDLEYYFWKSRTFENKIAESKLLTNLRICTNQLYAYELLEMNESEMDREQRTALFHIKKNYKLA